MNLLILGSALLVTDNSKFNGETLISEMEESIRNLAMKESIDNPPIFFDLLRSVHGLPNCIDYKTNLLSKTLDSEYHWILSTFFTDLITFTDCGMAFSSNVLAYGIGTSAPVTRTIGASR